MSRNNINQLSYNTAQANIQRSKFKSLSHSLSTTFNEGDFYPILCQEVLPGDTFSIKTSSFVRMTTLIAPTFGSLYLDTYYFFVPYRLVWDHWKEFMGENSTGYWTQETEYTIPQILAPHSTGESSKRGFRKGTLGYALVGTLSHDINAADVSLNALPFRGTALIWNEWFRSENLQEPYMVHKDETTRQWDYTNDLNALELGGFLPKVGKLRDLFVSCLPEPQKGPAVELPIGGQIPVLFGKDVNNYIGKPYSTDNVVKFAASSSSNWVAPASNTKYNVIYDSNVGLGTSATQAQAANGAFTINNAFADLSSSTAVTINEMRLAFQTQRLLERDARGGTRYNELIYSHFNVICPDYRVQRSEYLGGSRSDINISPVVQNSESGTTPQGTITGISASGNVHHDFTKSFTEHGMILGFCCVRVKHTYSQGIPKFFSKKTRLDFYFPVLAHIGEVAVKNKEIYYNGGIVSPSYNEDVFGYMEAWYEYRHAIDRVSGEFNPTYSQPLTPWIFTDVFSQDNLPHLTGDFIKEGTDNVDRVVAVQSSTADQFKANFYFDITAVRPLPVHSTPGLIDHL